MTIDVESILVSCIRIYPEFDPDIYSSNIQSLRFSLDILGPKGTASFVRGSQLIMEEYWSSGVETASADSKANTSLILSESERNLTYINLASDAAIVAVSESFNPDSIQTDTVVVQNIQDSASISSTMFRVGSSERSSDTSTENVVSEIQSTSLFVSLGTMQILAENKGTMTSSPFVTSLDANSVIVDGTTEDLQSRFSSVQSRAETSRFEADSLVMVPEITSLMALKTDLVGDGILKTVSSMIVNNHKQESSNLFTGEKPFEDDKNQNSEDESIDDASAFTVGNRISKTSKSIFSIRTYLVGPEDATTPFVLEITKSPLHEASQTSEYVLYSSVFYHLPQNLPLEEMCSLINADKPSAQDNISKYINLTSEKCLEEIYISGSSDTAFQCHCRPKMISGHILQEPIQQRVEQIVKELTVDKKTLSSTTRKLTSAKDPRKSSRTIGTIGIALLITVGAFIVSLDLPNIIDLAVSLKRKIKISSLD
ncbi:hypothetical protein LOTGIDRAFT_166578 [Lottia gigantea]|uniref:Uncharacterized protein n=1 Tax=Lottia gigantea TaxID=225164 RepID=V3ZXU1_LOTGI|nr:hypothetical protein LOTGIDRAFT_166578 [Lottia gigantea]ESO87430.1 hypothetical protein LOTGIDRAFT_166578 [Lottia gigantea]